MLAAAQVKWYRTPEYYRGSRWRGTQVLDGGGALINQAIHGVDLLQWFAGMPVEVFAWTTRRVHTRIESEDTCVAALKFGSGAFGTIEASTALWPGFSRRIELCGEHGSIVMDDDDVTRWEFRVAAVEDEKIRAMRESSAMGSGAAAPMNIKVEGHVRQIQDFIDGIRERRPFFIEGREARKAVVLVRAIYESAAKGQPVELGTVPLS
jgi:predicted dehydrogenase